MQTTGSKTYEKEAPKESCKEHAATTALPQKATNARLGKAAATAGLSFESHLHFVAQLDLPAEELRLVENNVRQARVILLNARI